ncbi:polyprenyl synthetase family protein [Streptomyces humi]|uniref:polyprenyl synthetase family protein n=1 Tax=Streptomyces humi TaxID=1428620 RepID=UPI000628758C|nr:polyprenyl synthetase family protein [Streptomyces humi]
MSPVPAPDPPLPDPSSARRRVDSVLAGFLDRKAATARDQQLPVDAVESLAQFTASGGKRLRPMLCLAGWHAAGADPPPASVIQVAAALEMFHASALIHDDVMDDSPTRRGRLTVHQSLRGRHSTPGGTETARRFGTCAAILVGDLALSFSDELIHTAGLTAAQFAALLPLLDAMRAEVMYGQYLDLAVTGQPTDDVDHALKIVRYKTAKYTVERPLHIGAALAGGPPRLLEDLSRYALPIGEAFQLRDDLLGVFGDPAVTGKSRLDDLREGKHTALVALAFRHADLRHAELLHGLLGRAELGEAEAAQIRVLLTPARARVEDMIRQRHAAAGHLLDTSTAIAAQVIPTLRRLAAAATRRAS